MNEEQAERIANVLPRAVAALTELSEKIGALADEVTELQEALQSAVDAFRASREPEAT